MKSEGYNVSIQNKAHTHRLILERWGMKSNNGGWNTIYRKKSKFHRKPLDSTNPELALELCFNKIGKVWNKEAWAIVAKNYGHEPGLDQIFKECEIVKYELTN